MELHPFLEKDQGPALGLWYVMNLEGYASSKWVGPSCSYHPCETHATTSTNQTTKELCDGKVYIIGGTDPGASFSEVFVLDLNNFSWSPLDTQGLVPRYEHAVFSHDSKLYVFGGSNPDGNHNDIQSLDLSSRDMKWCTVTAGGATLPAPRTYHVSGNLLGHSFVVYSGGHVGSDPVKDKQVHVYDIKENQWSRPNTKGTPPKPRHGHLVVTDSHRKRVIVHGGMAGSTIYDDLHVLEALESGQGKTQYVWRQISAKRGDPTPGVRAAHAGAIDYAGGRSNWLYVFGGMNKEGALDDTWRLNLSTLRWECVLLDGPPPATRLDHTCCIVSIHVPCIPDIEDVDQILATTDHAHDVMDSKLRLGSASSARSSTGSERSHSSCGGSIKDYNTSESAANPPSPCAGSTPQPDHTNSEVTAQSGTPRPHDVVEDEDACPKPHDTANNSSSHTQEGQTLSDEGITVKLLLVIGGMDTKGNIFDDCLALRIE